MCLCVVTDESGGVVDDLGVHDGLREERLIDLVVSVLTEADEVDDDVALVSRSPLGGQLAHMNDGLGIVGVDVKNWRVEHLGDVRAVRGGSRVDGIGGESDLVVDDDVNRAASRVVLKVRQAEAFYTEQQKRHMRTAE